jgi:GntR family transcriptional regulator
MTSMDTPSDGLLVYERAQQYVIEMIEGPDFAAGDRIPSERELSERFRISRMTMRKAIDRLVAKGLLERRSTSGTYIPVPVIRRPITGHMFSHGISEIVRQCGGVPGSRLLFFEQHEAQPRVAEHLGIKAGDPLIVIRRLRTVNELPFCVETTHLPLARVPGLAADDLFGQQSLYALLAQRYGIEMGSGSGTISVSTATAQEAQLLGLRSDSPALIFRAVVSDRNGKPVEYLTSVNHPQRVVFETMKDET